MQLLIYLYSIHTSNPLIKQSQNGQLRVLAQHFA